MKIHTLKTWREYFGKVWSGDKRFEYRTNDRDSNSGIYLSSKIMNRLAVQEIYRPT